MIGAIIILLTVISVEQSNIHIDQVTAYFILHTIFSNISIWNEVLLYFSGPSGSIIPAL
jgi:hypothetical protein